MKCEAVVYVEGIALNWHVLRKNEDEWWKYIHCWNEG